MKRFLFIFFFLLQFVHGRAQSYLYDRITHISFGLDAAMPLDAAFKLRQGYGIGGTVRLIIPAGSTTDVVLTGSALSFKSKTTKDVYFKRLNEIVLMIGYRYSFTPTDVLYDNEASNTFYVEPNIGISLMGTSNKSFTYGPALGYLYRDKVDVALRYQGTLNGYSYFKTSFINFSMAYNFNF